MCNNNSSSELNIGSLKQQVLVVSIIHKVGKKNIYSNTFL